MSKRDEILQELEELNKFAEQDMPKGVTHEVLKIIQSKVWSLNEELTELEAQEELKACQRCGEKPALKINTMLVGDKYTGYPSYQAICYKDQLYTAIANEWEIIVEKWNEEWGLEDE